MRIRFSARQILLCTLSVAMLDAPASAQYFGQNKVQYKRLEFQTLRTEHFDIYFTPGDRVAVDGAARMIERWHERLSRTLLRRLLDRQPLILYSSHPEFEQTNVVPDLIDEATGGLTEPAGRRIVLPLAGTLADTDHVIGHELVHVFQMRDDRGRRGHRRDEPRCRSGSSKGWPNTVRSVQRMRRQRCGCAMPRGVKRCPRSTISTTPQYFPYRWGHAFGPTWPVDGATASCGGCSSPRRSPACARPPRACWAAPQPRSRRNGTPRFIRPTHRCWRRPRHARSAPVWRSAGRRPGGDLNVGPAISPDGRVIAFLSGRGIFSVDLYVADAQSGRILRRLTNTSARTHLSSLQFIRSAGAWDAGGRRLAVAAVTGGHAALVVFNTQTWRAEHEIVPRDVDEIFGPSWAPDGGAIAFTGMSGGVMDLYIYDLRRGTQRRLTNDAFADLQPAWSPDGRRIAFATDRFTTRLDTIAAGRYRLALFDIETTRSRRWGHRPRAMTSTRNGRRTAARCTSCRTATAFRTCTELGWRSNGTSSR